MTPETVKETAEGGLSIRDLLAVVGSYRLPFSRIENPPEWQRTEIVATKFTGGNPSQWAIREMQMVMAKDGEWEWEPSPSNRDDDFLTRTRFDTAEDAAECALKFSSANAGVLAQPTLNSTSQSDAR